MWGQRDGVPELLGLSLCASRRFSPALRDNAGMDDTYDIVIIGAGVAGLTAALTAARLGRSSLVLIPLMPGGQLATIDKIEDFPGFPQGVAGYDLGPMLQEQAMNAGAACRMAEATALTPAGDAWTVTTTEGDVTARAVILATGAKIRALGIPGEERLTGKGVSQCASCDGPILKGKPVVVVGAGDSGLQEALALAEFGGTVTVVDRAAAPAAQESYRKRVAEHPKITVRTGIAVEEILGDDVVTGARVSGAETIAAEAVFVYAGLAPESTLVAGLVELDASGHVPVDASMRTTRKLLYAAGDVRAGAAGQAITAAADGSIAATTAHRDLG